MSVEIHPSAIVEKGAELGSGCVIGPWAYIGANVRMGSGCTVGHHATVDGHTTLGNDNTIHPYAYIGGQTQDLKYKGARTEIVIGDGNNFREFCTVHSATGEGNQTAIGSHNHFLAYTHIAHECAVGSHVIMSNNGTLAGHVVVEDYAVIGGLSAVHQFCRIGQFAMLGGCVKVVQDVPPFMIIDGNPGKVQGFNKIGLERAGRTEQDVELAGQVYRILYRDGLNRTQALDKLRAHPDAAHWTLQAVLDFAAISTRGFARGRTEEA